MTMRVLPMVVAAALGVMPLAGAAAPEIPAATPSAQSSDRAAIEYAIQDSVAEVQLCRLALQHTQTAAVSTFANAMIAQHTAMIDTARTLGQRLGANTELKPDSAGQIELRHLSRYTGHEFDEEFLQAQISDHRTDIETLRAAMEGSNDQAFKAWAKRTLTELAEHLRLANDALTAVEQTS